jgi:ribosome-binding protein aMBF1 (putative translation factor)
MPYRAWSCHEVTETVRSVSDRRGQVDPRLRAFGSRLRQLREDAGLTVEELAHRSQLGARQISRVEAGRASPSVLWVLNVSQGLDVAPDRLFMGLT